MINVYYHVDYRYVYYDITTNKLSIHVDSLSDLLTAGFQPNLLPANKQLPYLTQKLGDPLFTLTSIDELLPYLESHPELLI